MALLKEIACRGYRRRKRAWRDNEKKEKESLAPINLV